MKITDVRVREVSIPRIYGTFAADRDQLQPDTDHRRSRYQVLELFTDVGPVGLGEVSDMADRMDPLSADELRDLLAGQLVGRDLGRWREAFAAVGQALPADCHPELRGLTLFGVEIALLDLVGKRLGAPLHELLGGRFRDRVEVCWVAYMRNDMPVEAELDALADEVRGKLEEGIRAFKMKVGGDPGRDLERVRAPTSICAATPAAPGPRRKPSSACRSWPTPASTPARPPSTPSAAPWSTITRSASTATPTG